MTRLEDSSISQAVENLYNTFLGLREAKLVRKAEDISETPGVYLLVFKGDEGYELCHMGKSKDLRDRVARLLHGKAYYGAYASNKPQIHHKVFHLGAMFRLFGRKVVGSYPNLIVAPASTESDAGDLENALHSDYLKQFETTVGMGVETLTTLSKHRDSLMCGNDLLGQLRKKCSKVPVSDEIDALLSRSVHKGESFWELMCEHTDTFRALFGNYYLRTDPPPRGF